MSVPTLSICIPTYNRADYLEDTLDTLEFTASLPFTVEIVISDNASNDRTAETVERAMSKRKDIRYFRQRKNFGPEGNSVSALRLAMGTYCLYLGDDDKLIPDRIPEIIDYLEDNPKTVAYYTPWQNWDDKENFSFGNFYNINNPRTFELSEISFLFDFIVNHHIFPEIAIYKTQELHKICYMPHKIEWSFIWLVRLLQYGDVHFNPVPFYRFVINPNRERDDRQPVGMDRSTTVLDRYRGALEWFLYKALQQHGHISLPEDLRTRALVDGV